MPCVSCGDAVKVDARNHNSPRKSVKEFLEAGGDVSVKTESGTFSGEAFLGRTSEPEKVTVSEARNIAESNNSQSLINNLNNVQTGQGEVIPVQGGEVQYLPGDLKIKTIPEAGETANPADPENAVPANPEAEDPTVFEPGPSDPEPESDGMLSSRMLAIGAAVLAFMVLQS